MIVQKRHEPGGIPFLYFIAETDDERDLLADVLGSPTGLALGEYCPNGLEVIGQATHCHNCHASFVRLMGHPPRKEQGKAVSPDAVPGSIPPPGPEGP